MDYELSYTFKEKFLLIQVKGADNYEIAEIFFSKLFDLCNEYNCKKILVISNSKPLSTREAYSIKDLLKEIGYSFEYRMAWIENNPDTIKIDKFIETVFQNWFSINAKLFSEESEAKNWLLNK